MNVISMEDTQTMMALAIMEPPRILIVEDDPGAVELVSTLVRRAGLQPVVAGDATQALLTLTATFIPIVIIDRSLPGMDGVALCQAIRAIKFQGYIYIFMFTASDSDEDMRIGMDAGADDYLSKSISNAHFMARIKAAMRILSLEHSLTTVIDAKRQQSITDALTGVFNRRYFERTLATALAQTLKGGTELSLLMLDIDKFKAINDGHGHDVGDRVLEQLAAYIKTQLRASDWVARIGGEEFAIVLPSTALSGAMVFAERLRKSIEILSIEGIAVTVSIGVSSTSTLAEPTAASLFRCADQLLFLSKGQGRNRISFPRAQMTVTSC